MVDLPEVDPANKTDVTGWKRSVGKLPLMEVFGPTMQGEGFLAGQRSYFIRLGGCSYRCKWCDSMHAVDPVLVRQNAKWLSASDIADMIVVPHYAQDMKCDWVTISGGDPAIWDIRGLISFLHRRNFKVAIETQGAVNREWFNKLDLLTISPKPPSSGMLERFEPEVLTEILSTPSLHSTSRKVLKIVIASDDDLDFACYIAGKWSGVLLFLSACTPVPDVDESLHETVKRVAISYRNMVKRALKRPELQHAILLPQLHTLVWGHQKGV